MKIFIYLNIFKLKLLYNTVFSQSKPALKVLDLT